MNMTRFLCLAVVLLAVAGFSSAQISCNSTSYHYTLNGTVGINYELLPPARAACYFIEPRGAGVGMQPRNVTLTVDVDIPNSCTAVVYNAYVPNKNAEIWRNSQNKYNGTLGAIQFEFAKPVSEYQVFYVQVINGNNDSWANVSFHLSWSSHPEIQRVYSVRMFAGVTVAVLMVIIGAGFVKLTLRRPLLRLALKKKRIQQRINTTPPQVEQIIVWSTVGVAVILFIALSAGWIPI